LRERRRHVRSETRPRRTSIRRIGSLLSPGARQIRVSELAQFLQESDDTTRDGFVRGSIVSCVAAFGGRVRVVRVVSLARSSPPVAWWPSDTGRSNSRLSAMDGLPEQLCRIGLRAAERVAPVRFRVLSAACRAAASSAQTPASSASSPRASSSDSGTGPCQATRILGCAVSARSYDS